MFRIGGALVVLALIPICVMSQDRAGPPGELPTKGGEDSPNLQNHELDWWSVDGGGGASTGGEFGITAAAGQPETGISSNGSIALGSGLWAGAPDFQPIFNDDFETGDHSLWSAVTPVARQTPGRP